jgi:hypothetical protein
MENDQVNGQLFDYMQRLRNSFGQQWVFGILSTYDKWRILWLSDCNEIAQQKKVNTKPGEASVKEVETIPNWKDDLVANTEEAVPPPSTLERQLCGTKSIKYNDPQILKVLASVILKMYYSPRKKVALVDPKRIYISLNTTSWYWTTFSSKLNISQVINLFDNIYIFKMPNANTKSLILLQDFGGGAHGRVWLACSVGGGLCVVKFSTVDSIELLETERSLWNNIWGVPARIQQLCGQDALVMPFVKPCNEDDKKDKAVRVAVISAIKKMAQGGYCHEDLR